MKLTHTIGDLMAYVDKLVDTQNAVMHDFSGEDHDDGGTKSRKRSGEAYVADPPRPSTFHEGDFNMVMDDQCQFHRDAKHNMRECEQLKRALVVSSTSKRTRSSNNNDQNGDQRSTTLTVDLIGEITVIVDPMLATMTGIYMIIVATTSAMTGVTNTVAMTATIGVMTTGVIIAKIAMTTSARSKAIDRPDQTPGRSGTSTQKTRGLCVGLNSQSLSPGKIIGFTSLTLGLTRWSLTP
jgi:hypothetical protein